MKISAALEGVERLYVDTSPIIYYVETHPSYIERMDALIAPMKRLLIQGVCSVITLAEVLPRPLHLGHSALVAEYRDILLNSVEFECLSIGPAVGENAAHLRALYNLKTPDALHIAAAVVHRCNAFLTNDAALKRISEIRILILDELELDLPLEPDVAPPA